MSLTKRFSDMQAAPQAFELSWVYSPVVLSVKQRVEGQVQGLSCSKRELAGGAIAYYLSRKLLSHTFRHASILFSWQ